MSYDNDTLNTIYDKTDGYCHLCHKKLAFSNYGVCGAKGAWHVEHSKPKFKGGSDHLNNLYAACIKCNLSKGTLHTKTARAGHGVNRAPYNRQKKNVIKNENIATGITAGGTIGAFFGPGGIILGSIFGAIIGNENSPRR